MEGYSYTGEKNDQGRLLEYQLRVDGEEGSLHFRASSERVLFSASSIGQIRGWMRNPMGLNEPAVM